jgi:Tfp pilus assembly protein PilP
MNDNLKSSKIPEELVDSLRKAFKANKNGTIKECPMSELAISYASGELALEDDQKIRDHLQTCRDCLDLVLDIHIAESESHMHKGKFVEVLPAVSEAIGYSKRFAFLKKITALISKYIAPLISPKFIAPLATACLLVIILTIGFNNPKTLEKYGETVKKITPLKEQKTRLNKPEQSSKPVKASRKETPSIHIITPQDQEKIDPFAPRIGRKDASVSAMKKSKKRIPRSPLEKMDLSQLKLVGVIIASSGNVALVEDLTGKGYVVEKGTTIGPNSGKVIQVLKNKVIVEEEIEDGSGRKIVLRKELELQNSTDE